MQSLKEIKDILINHKAVEILDGVYYCFPTYSMLMLEFTNSRYNPNNENNLVSYKIETNSNLELLILNPEHPDYILAEMVYMNNK